MADLQEEIKKIIGDVNESKEAMNKIQNALIKFGEDGIKANKALSEIFSKEKIELEKGLKSLKEAVTRAQDYLNKLLSNY